MIPAEFIIPILDSDLMLNHRTLFSATFLHLALFLVLAAVSQGDDIKTSASFTFRSAVSKIKNGNSSAVEKEITEWEQTDPTSPDLAAVKANALFSSVGGMVIDATSTETEAQPGALSIQDPDSGEVVGYMGPARPANYDELAKKALNILSEASTSYPRRLDLRLGAIYLVREVEGYEAAFARIDCLIRETSQTEFRSELWTDNEPALDSRQRLADALHMYYSNYTESGDPDDKLAFQFADLGAQAFPGDKRLWNDLAREYGQKGKLSESIQCLEQASRLDPEDDIVLMNLGHCYTLINNISKARDYYKKVTTNNHDKDLVESAQDKIKELDLKVAVDKQNSKELLNKAK